MDTGSSHRAQRPANGQRLGAEWAAMMNAAMEANKEKCTRALVRVCQRLSAGQPDSLEGAQRIGNATSATENIPNATTAAQPPSAPSTAISPAAITMTAVASSTPLNSRRWGWSAANTSLT